MSVVIVNGEDYVSKKEMEKLLANKDSGIELLKQEIIDLNETIDQLEDRIERQAKLLEEEQSKKSSRDTLVKDLKCIINKILKD